MQHATQDTDTKVGKNDGSDWAHTDALSIIKTVTERDFESAAAIIAERLRRVSIEGVIIGIERERQLQMTARLEAAGR